MRSLSGIDVAENPVTRAAALSSSAAEAAEEVLSFWREAGPALWFARNPAFDCRFRERFLGLHWLAARGELDSWRRLPEGSLALVLLLDQFPRNAFRGTPGMYATDAVARAVADAAIALGHDMGVAPELRLFFYLPFGHSEDLADQDRCVALTAALGEPNSGRAVHHRDIVRAFGRFPHRNAILGRESTPEEIAFLAAGGYAG